MIGEFESKNEKPLDNLSFTRIQICYVQKRSCFHQLLASDINASLIWSLDYAEVGKGPAEKLTRSHEWVNQVWQKIVIICQAEMVKYCNGFCQNLWLHYLQNSIPKALKWCSVECVNVPTFNAFWVCKCIRSQWFSGSSIWKLLQSHGKACIWKFLSSILIAKGWAILV